MNFQARARSVSALAILTLTLSAATLAATEPAYNPSTVTSVSGVIAAISDISSGQGMDGMHVTLRTKTGTVEVYLAPRDFLNFLRVNIAVGDELDVIGSQVSSGAGSTILARVVSDGRTSIELRDALGAEVWKHWGSTLTKTS
ncbi:MAG: hypothetical protein ABL967_02825 [Bryobacteraceae bacterium]